jgi:hypothetical protein
MKDVHSTTVSRMSGLAAATYLVLLTACASTSERDWQTKIGRYSLDDVKRELGQPESCTGLDDGGTVCSWLTGKGREGIDKLVLTFGTNGKLATSNHVHF